MRGAAVEAEPKKYFTPDEVNVLISHLTLIMGRVIAQRAEVLRLRGELREEQHRIMAAGGGILDREAWRSRADRIEALTPKIREAVGAIMSLGGVPKDLGMGLVDFPHLMDGREVNLCWRFGETRVGFWHGLEEGYTSRKPL